MRGTEEARCKNCCRKLKGQKRRFAQEGLKACLVERRSSSRSAAAAIKPLTALRVAVLKGLESLPDWLHTLCTMKDERSSFSQPLVFRQELKDIGARHLTNSPRYSNRTNLDQFRQTLGTSWVVDTPICFVSQFICDCFTFACGKKPLTGPLSHAICGMGTVCSLSGTIRAGASTKNCKICHSNTDDNNIQQFQAFKAIPVSDHPSQTP